MLLRIYELLKCNATGCTAKNDKKRKIIESQFTSSVDILKKGKMLLSFLPFRKELELDTADLPLLC